MLDDAGYKKGADGIRTQPDGTPMTFKLTMVQGFTDWISAGEIMVQNWKDVGVDVETTMIDPGAFFGSVPMGALRDRSLVRLHRRHPVRPVHEDDG